MPDLYRKLRNTRKRVESGFYDRRAASLNPSHESTVTDSEGNKVNRWYGAKLGSDALEAAKKSK